MSQVDKEQLAQALDKIHTSASQSDALTTFNDFAPPPVSAPVDHKGSPTDLVHQGISGLYSRIKEAVGVGGKSHGLDPEEVERYESAAKRGKSLSISLNRADTISSQTSDFPQTASSSGFAALSETSVPQSSKASSVGTSSTAKSAPSLPKIVKGTAPSVADTAVAPVTVSAFKESDHPRGVINRTDDNGRRIINQLPDIRTTSASRTSSVYDPSDSRQPSFSEKVNRNTRRDGSFSQDGSMETPLSPVRTSSTMTSTLSVSRARPTTDNLKKPAVIDRISRSRTSAEMHSRSSSLEGTAEPSPINMSAHGSVYHDSFSHNEKPEKLVSGGVRIPGTRAVEGTGVVSNRLEMMRKQVLSKEFWMADETTKECFLCGAPFSAFRRKHHCRTCGCIFDSKCTSTISGQKFGVPGTLKVCKTCLDVINSRYEADSDDSDNDTYLPAIFRSNPLKQSQSSKPKIIDDDAVSISERAEDHDGNRMATAPMMAIPATRRITTDANRRSAVLEIDAAPHQLSRPSSSRSLRSLASGRPQSSGHRRHHSKHNLLGRLKGSPAQEDSAPFRKSANEELQRKSKLPAFHDDNIIDPELAPYMSEESSGDEQQMSIFATMNSSDITPSSLDPDKSNFGPFLSAGRRHRVRGEKSISGLSVASRGQDEANAAVSIISHGRPARRRNMSTTSQTAYHLRSPRPRSAIFKGAGMSTESLGVFDVSTPIEPTKITRSDSVRKSMQDDELPDASLQHVKKLFGQLLQDSEVPNAAAWEKALVPILIRCSNDVDPDTQMGDLMDIRHYVKFKKIPGGKPGDTSYVSGVIFTKNLALKSMPRRIANPRIVIVSFPIEYQRHQQQHFMSLQPVIEQEKEYLRMVVNRISNLRPHVLLAHKSVSGVALQYLSEAGIAVAYNVKLAVIEAVSRIAKADIIESLDMLVLPTQVGQAGGFEVKTYVNNDFPGRKKTYIFISGCKKELGCTIALRGAATETLRKMKRVTEFMIYVVYNLKLEAALLRDHFVYMGTDPEGLPTPTPSKDGVNRSIRSLPSFEQKSVQGSIVTLEEQPAENESSSQLNEDLTPRPDDSQIMDYAQTPRAEKSQSLLSLHSIHSTHDSHVPEDVPAPQFYSDMVAKYETKILSASPFVKFTQPYLLMKAREQERRLVYLKRLRDQDVFEEHGENEKAKPQKFQLIKPEMVHEIGQKAPRQIMEVLHAVHDAEYDKALYNYQTQTRQWENFIAGALDLFDPYSHQNIVVLYSVICTETKIPCSEPGLIAFGFYHDDPDDNMDPDCTLGQYIEDLCGSSDSICHANGCDRQMAQHHRTYVHDEARITVFIEKNSPLPFDPTLLRTVNSGLDEDHIEDPIYLWSYCKLCKKDMGFSLLSDTARKYSFGKYLELSFWGRGLKCWPDLECPHDYQKDHIRYFNYRDTSMRIHWDPIDLLEIIVPRARLTWKVDRDLKLKNDIFIKSEERWIRFMTSVKTRLKSIRIDSVLPEKADVCRSEVEKLTKKAQEEQSRLIRDLQAAYINSKYYEVIPLNVVIRTMLEKVEEWNASFAKFEADFLSDKDVRQLTIIQLKKMFSDNESKESLPTSADGTSIASADTDEKSSLPTTQSTTADTNEKTASEPHLPSQERSVEELVDGGDAPKDDQQSVGDSGETPKSDPAINVDAPTAEEAPSQSEQPLQEPVGADQKADAQVRANSGEVEPSGPPATENPAPNEGVSDKPSEPTPAADPSHNVTPEPSTSTKIPTPMYTTTPSRNHSRSTSLRPDSSLSLTEKVEQIRRQQQQAAASDPNIAPFKSENGGDAPKVPERGSSRKAGLTVSPPITRSITQPVGVIPRSASGIGRPLQGPTPKSAELPPGADVRRISNADSTMSAKSDKSKLSDRFGITALKAKKAGTSSIPRYVHGKRKESKVSTLARHFEQLSREFEKERIRDRNKRAAKLQSSRSFMPRTSAKAIVEVYEDVDQAVQEPGPEDDQMLGSQQSIAKIPEGTQNAAAGVSEAPTPAPETSNSQPEQTDQPSQPVSSKEPEDAQQTSQAGSDDEGGESEGEESLLEEILPDVQEIADSLDSSEEIPLELPKHQKSSLMKMLTTFWAERSASGWPPLDYPLNVTDHIFIDSDVIVREDEPSSLIAFALSSEDYMAKLGDIQHYWKKTEHPDSESEAYSDGRSIGPSDSDAFVREEELEKSLLRATGTHLKYQFAEGSCKMLCKIFFAEQFDALRRKCGAADRIVESLSRCLKWDSKGGKTKSVFLKTLDDRLVMKSLSPIETSAFLRFAPAYFNIMAEALFHDLPSVIAKMLGFFQVIIKNPATGTEIKLDLLVMENLFYDRSPTRIFDLKGSMRNRKIQSTGEQNEVLLDENMVEYIYESPLFAREHSKKLLRASVSFVSLLCRCPAVLRGDANISHSGVERHALPRAAKCNGLLPHDRCRRVTQGARCRHHRLYSHLHLGQATRVLDQGPRIRRRRSQPTDRYLA